MKQTTESLINASIKKEESCENNGNVNLESILESIDIKEENVELEPEFVNFLGEQNSIIEQKTSEIVEFVGIEDVKIEKVDEYNKEEDTIKINEEQRISLKNMKQTNEMMINERIKKEESYEYNENVNLESILHESIEIKEEDVELEPEFVSSLGEQNSIIEHRTSGIVELVGIEDVKIEKVDEYNKEEGPIKINEDTFTCDYCKRAFTKSEYCQKHIRSCRDRVYIQPSTSATSILKKKPGLTNDGEKLYQCDKCDNKYKSQNELNKHLRRHSGVGLHNCTECHKQFPAPSALARHLLIHTGEKPYKCILCEAAFNKAGSLKRHMLIHNGARSHKCYKCGQSFMQSYNLTAHMRTHMGERPYQCTQCNKTFIRSCVLTQHMRTHTGERPYQCTQCNKGFSTSTNLTSHIRTHTGEKTYQCAVCRQAFVHKGSLKYHMKSHSKKTSNKS